VLAEIKGTLTMQALSLLPDKVYRQSTAIEELSDNISVAFLSASVCAIAVCLSLLAGGNQQNLYKQVD
jgi:hypothetical protein